MKLIAVKDIVRKDVPIYYRRIYTGIAKLDLNTKTADYRIEFSIEHKPTGEKLIQITFIDTIDYPILPLTKELKTYIDTLDSQGDLPD